MIIVLMGPPGAGKGTQARRLMDNYSIIQLATGDMFREKIALGDEVGKRIKSIIDAGALVPDDLTIQMIRDRIVQKDCNNGFILDGFPRTVAQAKALDVMLLSMGHSLNAAIQIEVNDDILVERITGRYTCEDCGEGYHETFKVPEVEDVCDECEGTSFIRRADDNEETIRNRLDVYHKQTAPILPFYKEKGLLNTVDGMLDMDLVTKKLIECLGVREKKTPKWRMNKKMGK